MHARTSTALRVPLRTRFAVRYAQVTEASVPPGVYLTIRRVLFERQTKLTIPSYSQRAEDLIAFI
jgi:hypothetical protein